MLIFMAFASSACIKEEMREDAYGDPCEYIRFKVNHQQMTKGTTEESYEFGYLNAVEEEWPIIMDDESMETRIMPAIELDTLKASVSANLVSSQGTSSFFSDRNFYFDYETLEPETIDDYIKWEGAKDATSMEIAAFSPRPNEETAFKKNGDKYTYTVDMNDPSKHLDIIAATKTINNSEFGKSISLDFNHMLTGVRFKMGFECYVKKIQITKVITSITIDQKLIPSHGAADTFEYSLTDASGKGEQLGIGDFINYGDETFMMVPQDFLTDASVFTLTYTETPEGDEKTLSTNMKGRIWKQGKLITYTVKKVFAPTKTIYFDLAAGDVEINASTYKGYHFVDGSKTEIFGNHAVGNMYYVFQSATTNRANTGETAKPTYKRVMHGTQTWGEYITNNKVVEEVIHAWDDKNGATATYEGKEEPVTGAKGAVRDAGREGTNNRIHITGLSTYHLTIDNIYSTYMEHSTSRNTGGIAFAPGGEGNSSLTIYLKGDNRVGCIHYAGHGKGNNLIIENGESGTEPPGTLTAADVDYYTGTFNEDYGLDAHSETGYYGNHWDSAIGHNDGAADVYGLAINSGIIFAGTTKAENCTAIGAGGNGYGEVTINGGTVTAVAATTGTAIGGGIGFHSGGGRGDVTIAGGDVYAYNLANKWDIPSSAIGGAGSSKAFGAEGIVLITNGNVYAYSALGTAIGGGSSQTSYGGQATITIKGGNITAKSEAGAGIGGGTGCSGGVKESGKTYNGGNAVINISGAPIIKTGSIGGGQTNAEGAYLGKANITVEGGDIQAQFIMEATGAGAGNAPSFTMTGGTIHNNDTASPDFYYISKNGGAVYMNEGTFLMTGGTIRDCSAIQGGAVYICGTENPTFTMTGGTIKSCQAKSTVSSESTNGGGLYLQNGTVTISGDAEIRECVATNGGGVYLEGGHVVVHDGHIYDNIVNGGNGGGICIIGGNFTMAKEGINGGNAKFSGNTAIADGSKGGNGGGIYVSSTPTSSKDVKVNLLSGVITENSADRLGGGICVDMNDDKHITVSADVKVGEAGDYAQNPDISKNRALIQGGGIFVIGSKAKVTIDNGKILDNNTAGYVYNENVANEMGIVALNEPEVTSSVEITFDSNNAAAIIGNNSSTAAKTFTQYVATSTNSLLAEPAYKNFTGNTFRFWHTDPNGDDNKGQKYSNGDIMNLSQDITLYAIW